MLGLRGALFSIFCAAMLACSLAGMSEARADASAYCNAWVNSLIPTRTAPEHEKTRVEVGFWPIEIGEIDDKNQTFFADFYMALLWWDPRLEFEEMRFQDATGTDLGPAPDECDLNPKWIEEEDHIWNPSLEFLALRGDPSVRAQRLLVESDGSVFYEARFAGTFKAKFDFTHFPFDTQIVKFAAQPFDETHSVFLAPYEDYFEGLEPETLMEGASELDLLDWYLQRVSIGEETIRWGDEPYSRITYALELKRKPLFFVLSFFLPVLMLVVLAGAVFWMAPRETETRINLSVTSLLTLVAFNLILRDQLPDLPYSTLADDVNSISLLYAIIAVFVVVFIHVLKNKRRDDWIKRIEPLLRFGFPISYAGIVAFLFIQAGAYLA